MRRCVKRQCVKKLYIIIDAQQIKCAIQIKSIIIIIR